MKQKMVIKVYMNKHKSRSKALKVAVGFSGVESVALKGDDMSQIEVTGDGVDAVALTTSLRKKVGYAEVVSVGAAGAGAGAGDQSMDDEKIEANPEPVVWPNYHVAAPLPHYDVCVVRDYDPYGCSIL
ncbi:hypothetical protein AB3S75_006312 [Citrus x aurantiifolia]